MNRIDGEIAHLRPLVKKIKTASSLQEKIDILSMQEEVVNFFSSSSLLKTMTAGLSQECEYVIKALLVIKQDRVLRDAKEQEFVSKMRLLLEELLLVEKFYESIGGILGYQLLMLEHMHPKHHELKKEEKFLPALPIDISEMGEDTRKFVKACMEEMNFLGEIYTVGGSADRLAHDCSDKKTLPAAMLLFERKTLLEWLLDDLSAREYLHYKLTGEQAHTPVALMTSKERANHERIEKFLEEKGWFERGKENFKLFCQPSVPTIDEDGNWCLKGPMNLLLRPGGHGVIWKLAQEEGVFDWLENKGIKKVLIRQINNIAAGIDHGLLAFTGIGLLHNKKFGFACCTRKEGSAEGMNVVVEKKTENGFSYSLRCIEYCEEEKYKQIENTLPHEKLYANTNILFADFRAIKDALKKCIIPGILLNMKPSVFETEEGSCREQKIGRLESTMQNIADYMEDYFTRELDEKEFSGLSTYLTLNRREKTISAIKKMLPQGGNMVETPEGCFKDLLDNTCELLQSYCGVDLDPEGFIGFYHPALGPLYEVIAQKIRKGKIKGKGYLDLQIAELDMENFELSGSLLITAMHPVGQKDEQGIRRYSEKTGRCYLKNVKVRNLGANLTSPHDLWQKKAEHKESCQIVLHGFSEFSAEDVTFDGDVIFEVEDGCKVTVTQEGTQLKVHKEKINQPSWHWNYCFNAENKIMIRKMR